MTASLGGSTSLVHTPPQRKRGRHSPRSAPPVPRRGLLPTSKGTRELRKQTNNTKLLSFLDEEGDGDGDGDGDGADREEDREEDREVDDFTEAALELMSSSSRTLLDRLFYLDGHLIHRSGLFLIYHNLMSVEERETHLGATLALIDEANARHAVDFNLLGSSASFRTAVLDLRRLAFGSPYAAISLIGVVPVLNQLMRAFNALCDSNPFDRLVHTLTSTALNYRTRADLPSSRSDSICFADCLSDISYQLLFSAPQAFGRAALGLTGPAPAPHELPEPTAESIVAALQQTAALLGCSGGATSLPNLRIGQPAGAPALPGLYEHLQMKQLLKQGEGAEAIVRRPKTMGAGAGAGAGQQLSAMISAGPAPSLSVIRGPDGLGEIDDSAHTEWQFSCVAVSRRRKVIQLAGMDPAVREAGIPAMMSALHSFFAQLNVVQAEAALLTGLAGHPKTSIHQICEAMKLLMGMLFTHVTEGTLPDETTFHSFVEAHRASMDVYCDYMS